VQQFWLRITVPVQNLNSYLHEPHSPDKLTPQRQAEAKALAETTVGTNPSDRQFCCRGCGVEADGVSSHKMDSHRFQELLTLARRHLAEARQVIREQEELIKAMLDKGADASQARALVEKLRASAAAMAEHERSIEQQIQAFEQDPNQG
jgi:hypothetical protein